jgi:hypothetical protein
MHRDHRIQRRTIVIANTGMIRGKNLAVTFLSAMLILHAAAWWQTRAER